MRKKQEIRFYTQCCIIAVCGLIIGILLIKLILVSLLYEAPDIKILDFKSEVVTIEKYMDLPATCPATMGTVARSIEPKEQYVYLGSIRIKNKQGVYVDTDVVRVDIDTVYTAYTQDYEYPDWDEKERIALVTTLWQFLVEQQNIPESNAAAIIGCIYAEGDFAEHETTYKVMNSITDARNCLGSGEYGVGIAQWTYHTRQKDLLKYYEMANEQFGSEFAKVKLLAECSMLIEELKAYEIFDDIYTATSIEDATGRVGKLYETYDGCFQDWKEINGTYKLQTENSGGSYRLDNAWNIYNYFKSK